MRIIFQTEPEAYPSDRNPALSAGSGAIRLILEIHPNIFSYSINPDKSPVIHSMFNTYPINYTLDYIKETK